MATTKPVTKPVPIYFTDGQKQYLVNLGRENGDTITANVRRLVENEMFKSKGDEHGN